MRVGHKADWLDSSIEGRKLAFCGSIQGYPFFLGVPLANNFGWISGSDRVFGQIVDHDTAGADNTAVPDVCHNKGAVANPAIFANGYLFKVPASFPDRDV